MKNTTNNGLKVKAAGNAIGGAPLHHVTRGREVVGTIREVFPGMFCAIVGPDYGTNHWTDTMAEAVAVVARLA